jgi:MFS family permease
VVGGASVNFAMLVTERACQGLFGAFLAPSALSLLTVTFSDQRERGKAFTVYGAVAGAGGAIGLLLGGLVTQYLSWRWSLYVNLIFAGIAVAGARPAAPPAERRRPQAGPARCRARVGRHVLHGVRVLQGRAARLALRVVLGFPGRWRRRADRVRLVADQDRACGLGWADAGPVNFVADERQFHRNPARFVLSSERLTSTRPPET